MAGAARLSGHLRRLPVETNRPTNSLSLPPVRHLVKPAPGRALVYLDWACQEFFCAAYISGDKQMQEVLRSSDPYLGLAKMAGAAPAEATKRSHPELRRQFKALALAVMYGKGAYTLGRDLRISAGAAQDLLDKHKQLFARFWQWQDGMLSDALINYSMVTKLGWERKILPVSARSNGNRKDLLKSLANHPMQSTGAEMMRLASCYSTEAELQVCASVHDGFLLESSEEDIVRDTAKMVACMNRASRELLGAEVRVEAGAPITFPNRFIPDKPEARAMWALVMEVLEALERDAANHPAPENVFSLQEAQQ